MDWWMNGWIVDGFRLIWMDMVWNEWRRQISTMFNSNMRRVKMELWMDWWMNGWIQTDVWVDIVWYEWRRQLSTIFNSNMRWVSMDVMNRWMDGWMDCRWIQTNVWMNMVWYGWRRQLTTIFNSNMRWVWADLLDGLVDEWMDSRWIQTNVWMDIVWYRWRTGDVNYQQCSTASMMSRFGGLMNEWFYLGGFWLIVFNDGWMDMEFWWVNGWDCWIDWIIFFSPDL